jgi:hypothetical protein
VLQHNRQQWQLGGQEVGAKSRVIGNYDLKNHLSHSIRARQLDVYAVVRAFISKDRVAASAAKHGVSKYGT